MKKYDSYKDSGFDWLGNTPTHWEVLRMCYVFRPISIKNTSGEMNLSVYRDYGVIPTNSRSDNHNVISEDTSNYKLVEKGDFVMNKMKCWMGSLGLSDYRGIVSPSYTVMKPLKNNSHKYIHYLLRSKTYIPQYKRLSYGVREGQWDLRFEDFKELPCLIPSLSEQQQIVSFLDTKTSLIDSLIEKTQRKIELLKEKRTSLINEVVTKGLNPNVEMKDSGVEWIGEIPSHWGLSKLGFLSKPVQGIQVDVENQLYNQHEGSERFIRISDYTMEEEPRYIDSYPESSIVNEEDLVMVRYGSKSGKVYSGIKGVICNNVFRIEHNEKLYTKFLSYFLNQESFYNQIEMSRDNNTLPQVSHGLYKEMKITLPVILEQHQIVEYLDEQTQIIDNTISIEEKRIELLKEYRQSLISEVVTGKRKVV